MRTRDLAPRRWGGAGALALAAAALALAQPTLAASAASGHGAPTRAWASAQRVPGSTSLNTGDEAEVGAVACPSSTTCVVGGYASTVLAHCSVDMGICGPGGQVLFVATETNGSFGHLHAIPGILVEHSTTPGPPVSQLNALTCPSVGNCTAGGYTWISCQCSSQFRAWVATEVKGTWHRAQLLPGASALFGHGFAEVDDLTCRSSGNCVAAGLYTDAGGKDRPFASTETDGRWHAAVPIAVSTAVDFLGLSCPAAGECAGIVQDEDGGTHLVSESSGKWSAVAAPKAAGMATTLDALACPSSTFCAAGGEEQTNTGSVAVVLERHGTTWGTPQPLAGTSGIAGANVAALACTAAGTCEAGGAGSDPSTTSFVAGEVADHWQTAQTLSGTNGVPLGALACSSDEACTAVGSSGSAVWVSSGTLGGSFGAAGALPGMSGLLGAHGATDVALLACGPGGNCAIGGAFDLPPPSDSDYDTQTFVDATT